MLLSLKKVWKEIECQLVLSLHCWALWGRPDRLNPAQITLLSRSDSLRSACLIASIQPEFFEVGLIAPSQLGFDPSRWQKSGLDAMQLPTWSWLLQKSKWTCEIESWYKYWCFYLLPFFMFFVVKSKKWEILFLNFNLVVWRRSRALVGANKKATKGWRHALTTALISFREVLSLLKQRNIECANLKKCQQTILDIFCISCNLVKKTLSTYRVLQGQNFNTFVSFC